MGKCNTRNPNLSSAKLFSLLLAFISNPAFGAECDWKFSTFDPLETKVLQAAAENKFETGRHMMDYMQDFMRGFGKSFPEALQRLGPDQVWFDGGSGSALMLKEFFAEPIAGASLHAARDSEAAQALHKLAQVPLSQKPKVIGFTLTENPGVYLEQQKAQMLTSDSQVMPIHGLKPPASYQKLKIFKDGRFFEQIANEEIGRVNLITDYFGILSYTPDISKVLGKYFELLRTNGEIYIYSNSDTTIKGRTFGEFLKTIPGIEVTVSKNMIRVKKVKDHIEVPQVKLNPRLYLDGAPPVRFFH